MFQQLPTKTSRLQNCDDDQQVLPKADTDNRGSELVYDLLYKLRVFRRETLLWINLLNKVLTPPSRSTMSNSSTCSCSSLHVTLFFWDALDTRDHLLEFGAAICFDRSSNEDSITVTATFLASANRVTTLQLSTSAGEDFLLIFLNCFCAFLFRRNQEWILA